MSTVKKKQNRMLSVFLFLAMPTILEMLMNTVLLYVDTAMVGHLGPEATAAVSLSATYTWFFNNIMSSIGMGFLAYIARAIGEKNDYKIRHAAGMSVGAAITVGLILTVFTMSIASSMPVWMGADPHIRATGAWYFRIINLPLILRSLQIMLACVIRSTGDTRTPMKINMFMNILNIFLNVVFIYLLGYGAIGAGIATALSYCAGSILMILAFLANSYVVINPEYLRLEKSILKDVLKIGIPALLTGMVSCGGYIIATSFVSAMSTTVFSAHSIAITAEEMFYIPAYGMQAATSTLIGNALGEGDRRKEHSVIRVSLGLIFAIMFVTGILLFWGAEWMMMLFTRDPEVIRLGARLLRIVALSEPIYGIATVSEGVYIGLGRANIPLVIELIGRWGIRIAGSYVWINLFHGGIQEYWYLMVADNMIRALLSMAGIMFIIKQEKRADARKK